MDTNYKEQLAWYENTVKPYTVRPISIKTRVWHASATKPPPFIKQPRLAKSSRNSNGSNRVIPTALHEPNKPTPSDAKAEQPAIWTTNMETDNEEQENISLLFKVHQKFIDTNNSLESSKPSDEQLIDLNASSQEPTMTDSVAELRIRSPILRTMSEDTVYFDASNDWESEISVAATAIESDYTSISSDISQQQMIESRLALFNQKEFLPNQLESIYADFKRQDILLVMPCGPARDMCYLLPSTLQKSSHLITIVIVTSYASLQEKDANPSYNSDHVQSAFVSRFKVSKRHWIPSSQFQQAILDTTIPKPMTLLLTFGDFSKCKSVIQHLHQCNRLARIVLEDAHCFSQWGTDFHFGYLKIAAKLKDMYPNTPITALTAISNERVLADIMNSLHMPESTTRVLKRSILL
ncbi:hypothetical protein MAM1_0298d09386 [Mucor ambiguus]|uniref:DNA 3'-5' helicase n=1 Tax=Mucor ambiguus TaxID=91626 RepID=A0A0C9N5K6_9FUNG|nr:hypothetical protein MAM1_0298d09386 [Mucor ambiguus]